MANPFAQFAPRNGPLQPQEPAPRPGQPIMEDFDFNPPATQVPLMPGEVAPSINEFAEYGSPAEETDVWTTEVRGKKVTFQAPRGASTAQVRAAAKAAGIPDPQNRALQFGDHSDKKTYEQEYAAERPWTAALHQGVDFVFPFVDEAAAGLNSLLTGNSYTQNMRDLEDRSVALSEQNPWASNLGRAGYTLLSLPVAIGSKILQGGNWLNTSLRMGAAGAPYGATNAYLTNPIDDRWNGVPEAAAVGTVLGASLPGVSNITTSIGRRVDQRLGISDWMRRRILGRSAEQSAEQAAVDVMAARVPQTPSEMRAKAQEFRDTGHDPALVNVIDETGRGFVGAMARRPGPGRETAQRAFDARRLSMPERVDRNMAAVIDDAAGDPAVAAELRRPAAEVVADLTEKRTKDIEDAMAPIRNDPVPFTPRMLEILDTADGRRAISRAMRTVTDQDTLSLMRGLPGLVKQLRQIDPRMPQSVRDQVTAQLMQGQGLTVDVADRLARKFRALADSSDADAAPVLRGFAREFRDAAKDVSSGYRKAMDDYAANSKTIGAVETGEGFLATNEADDFARRASQLSDVRPAPGVPSDRERAMQGARREVQRAAGENISAAPGVARRIAVSPEQNIRNVALFGPLNAERLEKAMGISERQLKDFAQVAPNTGSQTAIRGVDDEAAAGAIQAMVNVKTGNYAQAALNLLRSIGVRDQDAGRIVEMAVDPARVDQLIDMLEKSYGKQTAQKLSRALALPAIAATSRTTGGSR